MPTEIDNAKKITKEIVELVLQYENAGVHHDIIISAMFVALRLYIESNS